MQIPERSWNQYERQAHFSLQIVVAPSALPAPVLQPKFHAEMKLILQNCLL